MWTFFISAWSSIRLWVSAGSTLEWVSGTHLVCYSPTWLTQAKAWVTSCLIYITTTMATSAICVSLYYCEIQHTFWNLKPYEHHSLSWVSQFQWSITVCRLHFLVKFMSVLMCLHTLYFYILHGFRYQWQCWHRSNVLKYFTFQMGVLGLWQHTAMLTHIGNLMY